MSKIYYLINNADVSLYVQERSLSVNKVLTMHASSASFTMLNPTAAPLEGYDVKIYLDSTSYMIFAGIIFSVVQTIPAPGIFQYYIHCTDYMRLFDRRLVHETYTDGTEINTIMNGALGIITDYTSGFTSNVHVSFSIIGDTVFDYRVPSDCLRELCDTYGSYWWIDYDKVVHIGGSTGSPPYNINDNTLGTIFKNFKISGDCSQIRNFVFVQGGYEESSEKVQNYKGNGVSTQWSLAWYPHDLTVKLNDVLQTLGKENVDTDDGTYAFMYNYFEKMVKCGSAQPAPGNDDTLSFYYKAEIPITTSAEDSYSQTNMANREGGDGIYQYIIRDLNLSSRDMSRTKARLELEKFKALKVTGSVDTYDEYGFEVGMYLIVDVTGCIHNSLAGGSYEISNINITSEGNNILLYNIEFEGYGW